MQKRCQLSCAACPVVLPGDMVIVRSIDACPNYHPLVPDEYPLEGSAQRHASARLIQETALGASGIGGKGAIEPPPLRRAGGPQRGPRVLRLCASHPATLSSMVAEFILRRSPIFSFCPYRLI